MNELKKIEWEEKYSVGVREIDEQHKLLIETINKLANVVASDPRKENLLSIIDSLINYKKIHFATEERYFEEFKFEGAEEHIAAHEVFGEKIRLIQEKNGDDIVALTYDLIDFLEDWFVEHMLTVDQEYKDCFMSHGLK
ncbi:MAG TPA: bacteriohemerythrin [Candidatus Methanoperedens sp.]|nr:bacteriohemerythrin [Candidatus Methanoperedens sp.]